MALASLLLLLSSAIPAFAQFTDPAPPTVHEIDAKSEKPPAIAQAGLKSHAAPRPLKPAAVTSDWPSFLGPNHNATSPETHLLTDLGKGPPTVWEVPRGTGYAAPAIAAGRVVLFHRVDDEEVIECLDAQTGKRFWRTKNPVDYDDRYGYSNGPRCAPVIDGERIYTFGVAGTLQCLDFSTGQVIWRREILKEFKLPTNFFGVGSTPLVEGDLLIVNIGATAAEGAVPATPTVAAFNKKTGRLVWGAGTKYGPSYASPIPADIQGHRRVLIFAGGESNPPTGGLICLNPADGKIDFEFDWRSRLRESVNASSPVVIGNRVFISECYGMGSAMLEITPEMKPNLLWTNEDFGTHFMTSLYRDGAIYGIHGHGPLDCPLVCLNADSGKELWRHEPHWPEKFTTPSGVAREAEFELNRAQIISIDGRALCLTENGHLVWLDLNPKAYKELSRAWLFGGEETWTGPVVSHGLLYVCQNGKDILSGAGPRLICYDLRE